MPINIDEFKKGKVKKGKRKFSYISDTLAIPPTVATTQEMKKFLAKVMDEKNRYKIYKWMLEIDPELDSAVWVVGLLCSEGFVGFLLDSGENLEDNEVKFLEELKSLAKRLKFKRQFISFGRALMKDGDAVTRAVTEEGVGVVKLQRFPMSIVSAVESDEQVGDEVIQVWEPNIYVINEGDADKNDEGESNEQRFPRDEIIHMSLDPYEEIEDNLGRYTFGVWSRSPIHPLKTDVEWKANSKLNDMLVRHRSIPREHHQLDLSGYDPENFPGTAVERLALAKAAATAACETYATDIQDKDADEGYITNKETAIGFIEPKNVNYLDPNKLIEQINRSEVAVSGVPFSALGGETGTYATAYTASGFSILRAKIIATIVAEGLEEICKIHFKTLGKYSELLDKFSIQIDLLMERDKTEVARRVKVMDEISVFMDNELRHQFGFADLTPEQKEEVMKKRILKSRERRGRDDMIPERETIPRRDVAANYPSEDIGGDAVSKSTQVTK